MSFARSVAVRITISLIVGCSMFVMVAGARSSDSSSVHAQSIDLSPPNLVAISPRAFLRGSASQQIMIIAQDYSWPINPNAINEVLWNNTPLSTSVSSGVYQATVPAGLLAVSQLVTVTMRKRNILTGEVGAPALPQSTIVTDTVATPVFSPTILAQQGEWQVEFWGAHVPITVTVRDRFGLPLSNAPVQITIDYGAFGIPVPVWLQSIVVQTDWSGNATTSILLQTNQLTRTTTTTLNITVTTIFVGEFASTTLSSTVVISHANRYLPAVMLRHPPMSDDFCGMFQLPPPTQLYSRMPIAQKDVFVPGFTQLPWPNESVITAPRGIQITNYSAVGRLELYAAQNNQCSVGGTVSATLLASTPIPPRSQQPFVWCPREAVLKPASQFFLIVVRNDAARTSTEYSISANFPLPNTPAESFSFCSP